MIVVEGPDGGGKTTIIEDIVAHLNWPVAPRVVSKQAEAMVDLVSWVEKNVREGFQTSIFDRHRLISEPIYGAVLRRGTQEGFDDVRWLAEQNFMFYRFCTPIIIYCLPPYETVRKWIQKDSENQPADIERRIGKIYSLYCARAAVDVANANAMVYDFTASSARNVLTHIDRQLGRIQNDVRPRRVLVD